MAVLTKYKSAVSTGTLAALLLVLIFGSPWVRDWAAGLDASTAGGWFAQVLTWPAWSFDADASVRDTVSGITRALLVVAFAALFLYLMVGSQSAGGTLAPLLTAWATFVFAGAAAGMVAAAIGSDPSLLAAFRAAGSGATYGLFAGWIVGIAALGGRRGGGSS